MAEKRRQPNRRKKIQPDVPTVEELFGPPISAESQPGDIFASLFDFTAEPERPVFEYEPDQVTRPRKTDTSRTPLSRLQIALVVGIAIVAGVFPYTLFKKSQPVIETPRPVLPPPRQQAPIERIEQPSPPVPPQAPSLAGSEAHLPHPQPLSLQVAEMFYLHGDFENALVTYDQLHRRLPATEENQSLRDFLMLRMALCSKNAGLVRQADNIFRTVALSRLPVLRALARYHQSTTLISRDRYLEAATQAYQTMALIEVVDYDPAWARAVQRQCAFLVAEALTRKLLSLRDADADVPAELWSGHPDIDPFTNCDEAQLKILLDSGSKRLENALLSPQIRAVADNGSVTRWSVTCNGAPAEELLSRFASNAKLDIQWIDTGHAALEEETSRRRPVYLYLSSATAQQVVTVAAGSVGLIARMDDRGTVRMLDPSSYASLADHTSLLADESVSLWQRFVLRAEGDQRVPNGHFALGLLHTTRDRLDEAISEYKLVAGRYSAHTLAPYALLHSGRLKVKLRDYSGAHDDLKQLVELYPETELSDRACLDMADATMKAGLYDEATDLYRKVFNMGLSLESQMESALGAGRCFYETQDDEAAVKWLNHYVTLARDQNRREFHAACLLLGKAYLQLNKPQQAHAALSLALRGELSRQQHVETIATLAKAYIQQGLLLEALSLLEGTKAWQLSQQETVELLLLRAQTLRSMGLVEKSIAILADRAAFLPGAELKGALALELATCYRENGDWELARETLSRVFALVEPGPLAEQIGRELARICLQLGRPDQALSVCSQLLEYAAEGAGRERLLQLQADAYRRQGKYDRAVSALLKPYSDRLQSRQAIGDSVLSGARQQ